jgi:hypothetical protein
LLLLAAVQVVGVLEAAEVRAAFWLDTLVLHLALLIL